MVAAATMTLLLWLAKGGCFDPDRFPFLEGRTKDRDVDIPLIPDSTVWYVLTNLIILDGERLSYRTLDVEQIGSVYESIMGFRVELTTGRSIAVRSQAVRSQKRTGASVIVNLDALLATDGSRRAIALQTETDRKLTGNAASMLRDASTPEEIVRALDRVVDRDATPNILLPQTPVLQPTDERRRTGSHYTPRSLTETDRDRGVAARFRPPRNIPNAGNDIGSEDLGPCHRLGSVSGGGVSPAGGAAGRSLDGSRWAH